MAVPSPAMTSWEGASVRTQPSELDIGRHVLRLDAVDRQPVVEPLADLLDAAVVVDPGVEEVAPALVRLHVDAHAGRQLHARLVQPLEFAKLRVLLGRGKAEMDHKAHQ